MGAYYFKVMAGYQCKNLGSDKNIITVDRLWTIGLFLK
jgi:hypothetical protein